MHSPSISVTLSNRPVSIWFNLVGFNGACWQSYGAVTGYSAFGPDDIFFFATELNPAIESEEELMADVENNPIPYLMLTSGSKYPLSVHGDDEILQVFAEHSLASFDKGRLNKDFKIEYNQGIYRISLEPWSDPPHYAQAYYAESKRQLLISSLTDRGFHELVAALNKHGFGLEEEPDIRVQLSMLVSIHHILGKKIQLNPYEELFKVKPGPEAQDEMDKVNRLLELAIPVIDAGMEPNFWELAKEAGVEEEMAREVIHTTMDRINKLKS